MLGYLIMTLISSFLLRWLERRMDGSDNYELVQDESTDNEPALRAVLASGLGVLRQDSLAARSFTAGPDAAASSRFSKLFRSIRLV